MLSSSSFALGYVFIFQTTIISYVDKSYLTFLIIRCVAGGIAGTTPQKPGIASMMPGFGCLDWRAGLPVGGVGVTP